jgi:MSHA biogenesis protein MshL
MHETSCVTNNETTKDQASKQQGVVMDMDVFTQKITKKIVIFTILATLGSCSTEAPKTPTSIEQMHATLREAIRLDKNIGHPSPSVPRSVSEAMLPQSNPGLRAENQLAMHRFNVSADKMPAKVFFTGLVDGTPYNMAVAPNIEGEITLSLKNVTIQETMDAVRDMYGYEYRKTSYGYEVSPPELETQIFNINYLDVTRNGKSTTEMTSGQVSNKIGTVSVGGGSGSGGSGGASVSSSNSAVSSSSVSTTSEVNFWRDLDKTLKQLIVAEKDHTVVVNPQAGLVIVRAFPIELHRVARYLNRVQSSLHRQIIIEAKVLEVQLNNSFDSGIDWSLMGNPLSNEASLSQSGNGPNSTGAPGLGGFNGTQLHSFDPIFTINIKGSFRTLVQFLQTQGNVQTLSSPRISTVNNQKAVIKVGQDQFFVTGVSTTNTLVGTNTLPSQNVDLTPFFSGITLDVTPQISRNGTVILHIHPSVSVVTEQQKSIVLGSSGGSAPNTLSLPLALSTIRESDNIVSAKNGQIVVIGGLMQNNTAESIGGTPWLSKIPFIGALFRRTSQVATKSELVILLRPILVDNKVWTESLERADNDIQQDNRGFHVGGLPEIFGTRGEEQKI